jgi:ABC-type sugar transport system permease subunit
MPVHPDQILYVILVIALLVVVLSALLLILAVHGGEKDIAWTAVVLFMVCSLVVAVSAWRLINDASRDAGPLPHGQSRRL